MGLVGTELGIYRWAKFPGCSLICKAALGGKEVARARQKQAQSSHGLQADSKDTQSRRAVIPQTCAPGSSKSSHSYSRETHTDEYRETVQGCTLQHQKLETENINGVI